MSFADSGGSGAKMAWVELRDERSSLEVRGEEMMLFEVPGEKGATTYLAKSGVAMLTCPVMSGEGVATIVPSAESVLTSHKLTVCMVTGEQLLYPK